MAARGAAAGLVSEASLSASSGHPTTVAANPALTLASAGETALPSAGASLRDAVLDVPLAPSFECPTGSPAIFVVQALVETAAARIVSQRGQLDATAERRGRSSESVIVAGLATAGAAVVSPIAGRAAVAGPGGRQPGGAGEPKAAARPGGARSAPLEEVEKLSTTGARRNWRYVDGAYGVAMRRGRLA